MACWLSRCDFLACHETVEALRGGSPQGEQEQCEWLPETELGVHGAGTRPSPSDSLTAVSSSVWHRPCIDATVISTIMAMPATARDISDARFMSITVH